MFVTHNGIDFAENGDVFSADWGEHLVVHGNSLYVSLCSPHRLYNYTLSGILVGSALILLMDVTLIL